MEETKKCIQHYNSSQKILLVGEGNFSFSACLANAFGSASNMVATCLHSKEMLPLMHLSSIAHVEELKERGCLVLHKVDVCNMNQHHILKSMKFDVIVFNFPHAGHDFCLRERTPRLIEMHKDLVKSYFRSAKEMLENGGEIHVTNRDDYPYNRRELEKLAREESLVLKEKVAFRKENYPGYSNKRGSSKDCDSEFPLKQYVTFKFN